MKRLMALIIWLAVVLIVALALLAQEANAGPYCPTREEMITIVAHKADVEYGGRVPKWRVWQLLERESGLQHCWPNGTLKVSPTNDYGVAQMHTRGVWLNCSINPYCNDWSKVSDPFAQIDVMMRYYDRYRDFCPWNPTPGGSCNPGCGYY